ncbi:MULTISPECIES: histone-like nucleoid-structuring protein, MvaT/MvaU family [Pseudomonas]|uniref:Transcriptional activator, MvaT family n=2 Tax=Pseudomonas TaxID=286 RepID=I4K5B0_9PSED|nr:MULTISPECIES: histone-like nucleoid-structuring protein, MvaT/MvaU family [Pseudomonas]EIK59900.1 transcriptional activator, MvaT family [Pseudomonas lactis]MDD0983983.1 DNA binding protein [Pseudomonas shahriarae]MDD1035532.1 DNA binding protein [Pseudomonas shahriarae]
MSRLAEFRALEQQLAAQLAELETLKNDDGLKREIEFETKLRDLLGEYGYSLRNIVAILDPQSSNRRVPATAETKGSRKARAVKVYKNPHSGEVVETKGGNHKVLKEWKAEYGSDTVESWLAQ